eukprot:TRINITY_DN2047_c0_g1_i2.p1 TRINITY_DN2047_c0_g1~~TRINITY_DN2047_c0_g1_i2.p1  ORF type:complete len:466 (+),score=86.90 TRINITY_DN2047_c0_g1_i2:252-1649(+)
MILPTSSGNMRVLHALACLVALTISLVALLSPLVSSSTPDLAYRHHDSNDYEDQYSRHLMARSLGTNVTFQSANGTMTVALNATSPAPSYVLYLPSKARDRDNMANGSYLMQFNAIYEAQVEESTSDFENSEKLVPVQSSMVQPLSLEWQLTSNDSTFNLTNTGGGGQGNSTRWDKMVFMHEVVGAHVSFNVYVENFRWSNNNASAGSRLVFQFELEKLTDTFNNSMTPSIHDKDTFIRTSIAYFCGHGTVNVSSTTTKTNTTTVPYSTFFMRNNQVCASYEAAAAVVIAFCIVICLSRVVIGCVSCPRPSPPLHTHTRVRSRSTNTRTPGRILTQAQLVFHAFPNTLGAPVLPTYSSPRFGIVSELDDPTCLDGMSSSDDDTLGLKYRLILMAVGIFVAALLTFVMVMVTIMIYIRKTRGYESYVALSAEDDTASMPDISSRPHESREYGSLADDVPDWKYDHA